MINKKILQNLIVFVFLIMLISIECFATVVSEDDSTAFITKSEFEALKNNFANQIDDYNRIINDKIDGAIAEYLEEREQPDVYQFIYNNNWKEVYFINGILSNDTRLPSFDSVFTYFHNALRYSDNTYSALDIVELVMNYTNANTYNRQNICLNSDPTSASSEVVWKGRALNYDEHIITRAVSKGSTPHDGWSIDNAYNGYKIGDITKIKNSGVYTGSNKISTTNLFTEFQVQWHPSNNSNFQLLSKTYESSTLNCEVNLKAVNGVTLSHEHILNFKNENSWELADNTQPYALYVPQNGKKTTQDLANATTKSTNQALGHIYHKRNTESYKTPVRRDVTVTHATWTGQTSSTYTTRYVPRLGCVNGYRESSKIHQYDDNQSIKSGNKTFDIGNPNILNGFVLCVQEAEKEHHWEPSFEFVSYDGSTSVPVDYEIDVYLSTEPFNGDWTTVASNKLIKHKDTTSDTEIDHWTTSNRKIKMSWKANEASVIYCICCPSLTNCSQTDIINKNWEIKIDLSLCNKMLIK